MGNEQTVFFVKSHAISRTGDILNCLVNALISSGGFDLNYMGIFVPSEDFWREFYPHLKPEILESVVNSYHRQHEGKIALSLIGGEDMVQKVRTLIGPTRYEENPGWTVRGRFGPYTLPDTLVHASSLEEVERDVEILRKYALIN